MDFADDDTSGKIDEIFKKCQTLYRSSYPSSSLDFENLDLTQRVKQSRYAIGRGHHSDVYKGELDMQTLVGVKVLRLPAYDPLQERQHESVFLRFFRELNHWHQLDHINIARLLGFTLAHGNIGFVSLWYANGNLVDYLQKHPEASKPDLILDVAEGIFYLHNSLDPLLHGDLKGVNIFITERGIACLGDFGISKQISDLNRTTGFTTTSGVIGTTPWMAPELLNGGSVTFASDMYAFAGVLIEVCCPGCFPFHYLLHEMDVILAKHRGDPLDRTHYPQLCDQDDVWDIIVPCMVSDVEARPSIGSILRRLYNGYSLSPRVDSSIPHRPKLGDLPAGDVITGGEEPLATPHKASINEATQIGSPLFTPTSPNPSGEQAAHPTAANSSLGEYPSLEETQNHDIHSEPTLSNEAVHFQTSLALRNKKPVDILQFGELSLLEQSHARKPSASSDIWTALTPASPNTVRKLSAATSPSSRIVSKKPSASSFWSSEGYSLNPIAVRPKAVRHSITHPAFHKWGTHQDVNDIDVEMAADRATAGEVLFKHYHRRFGKGHSSKGHSCFFWLHTHRKMLYWSPVEPGSSRAKEGISKSVYVDNLRSVVELKSDPPGSHQYSLVVSSLQREVMFSFPAKEVYDIWRTALTVLITPTSAPLVHSPTGYESGDDV